MNNQENPSSGAVSWNAIQWTENFKAASESHNAYLLHRLRVKVYEHTVKAVRERRYIAANGTSVNLQLNENIEADTHFYAREMPRQNGGKRYITSIKVVRDDCLAFARRLVEQGEEVSVLNMASRRNPGGGVLSGSGAQEEYLFRCSDYFRSLYPFSDLSGQFGMSRAAESYPLDRDFGGIFSRRITVFRGPEEEGYPFLTQPWQVNFIAVAGMNRPQTETVNGEERIVAQLLPGMKNKLRTLFRIALHQEQHTLVLGALGCGAFRNPPRHVAELFAEVLHEQEFEGAFKAVYFVIKEDHNSRGRGNFAPFNEVLGVKA